MDEPPVTTHLVNMEGVESDTGKTLEVQFKSEIGELKGSPLELCVDTTIDMLQKLCRKVLQEDDSTVYAFFIDNHEITTSLAATLDKAQLKSAERTLEIIYQPQAVFRVRAVTRCSSDMQGHAGTVVSVQFSPSGKYLASGSGDKMVRFWDIYTETPQFECKGHKDYVICIAWSPDGRKLASACHSGQICIWNPRTGKQIRQPLSQHKQYIAWLCWKPLHLDPECRFLASASKDATVRIWDVVLGQCAIVISGHSDCITCVKWGGTDLLYTSSRDRTIKIWSTDGKLRGELKGHAHWVNNMALSTDYVIRTGAFDPAEANAVHSSEDETLNVEELAARALKRFNEAKRDEPERLVSASDDNTMFLWQPEVNKKPITRMTGHQQLVNQVVFSPDARLIASASFDKSIKLWNGRSGQFIATLHGHVQRVHQVSFAADSRLLCSGSADSTLKVWDLKTKKLMYDLPGHADEVFAVDWSPDGQRVVSGGRDKVLKIWRN